MIFDRLRRAFLSIHTRLLLVIVVAGLCILLLFRAAATAHREILADAFHSRVAQYVQYLVKDLGCPPDYNRAVEVAGQTAMIIHYLSPEARWSTSGQAQWPSIQPNRKWQVTGSIWGRRVPWASVFDLLNRQMVDLISLIREAIRPLEDQPPGVCLKDGPGSVEAFLDPEKAKTVFRNVIGNAIKYSQETSSPVAIRVTPPRRSTTSIRSR